MTKEKKNKNAFPELYIIDILKNQSNKTAPMNQSDIRAALNETAKFSISDNDKNYVPRHITAINNHFGKELIVEARGRNNTKAWYYDEKVSKKIDVLHNSHEFTEDEAAFLFDMIASCKLLTESGTKAMLEKLAIPFGKKWEESKTSVFERYKNRKNINDYVKSIFDDLIYYKEEKTPVNIEIDDGNTAKNIENAYVYAIYETPNGESRIILKDEKHITYDELLSDFKSVTKSSRNKNSVKYDRSLEDKLMDSGYDMNDREWQNIEIKNDTFFNNLRKINSAIEKKKYLFYNECKIFYEGSGEPPQKKIVPIKTLFKNGMYYLIAIDVSGDNEKAEFIRIDYMENVNNGPSLTKADIGKTTASYIASCKEITRKTAPVNVTFNVKEGCEKIFYDAFGIDTGAKITRGVDPYDTGDRLSLRIARRVDAEYFAKKMTGYDYSDNLVRVTVKAESEEDAIRFALENAAVAELVEPAEIRERIRVISKAISTRYSKTMTDFKNERFDEIIRGAKELVYGGTDQDIEIYNRVIRENACDKVKKLVIKDAMAENELKAFENVEQIEIVGARFSAFEALKELKGFQILTIKNTDLESGDALCGLNLSTLIVEDNDKLKSYEFLKSMQLDFVKIKNNRNANISALYTLTDVGEIRLDRATANKLEAERFVSEEMCVTWEDSDRHYVHLHRNKN